MTNSSLHRLNARTSPFLGAMVLTSALFALASCDQNPDLEPAVSTSGSESPTPDGNETSSQNDPEIEVADIPGVTADAIANYSAIVLASYEDTLEAAQTLDTAIQAFVADPTDQTLATARQAWLDAREPYLQTEAFRFYDGPIDNPDDGPEGLLNAWPLDEAHIDYTVDDATAGIVNNTEVDITAAALMEFNEQGGEKNVATGYHAIEFLLWGQDQSIDGAGDRPVSDYLTSEGENSNNHSRRAQYLTTVSSLLLTHLESLVAAWNEDGGNYRSKLESESPEESLRRVLTGLIVLSGFETGGERLQAALDSADQEDEHSCFSDNTHRDMVGDVIGVQNVYLGAYKRLDGSVVKGPGMYEVVKAIAPDLAGAIKDKIGSSLASAEALQAPFDNEISSDNAEGRERVQTLITELRSQEKSLEEAFTLFGLSIPVPE